MNLRTWARLLARLSREQDRPRQRKHTRRPRLEALEERLAPATDIWTGASTNNHWSTANNWSLGRAPTTGDDIIFGTQASVGTRSTVNDLAGVPIFNSISISAPGYTLGNLPLTPEIGVSGAFNVSGSNMGTETVSLNVEFAPPASNLQQTITVGNATVLDISGQIFDGGGSNAGNQTVTKAGTGTLELDGSNTGYSGAITIQTSGGIILITNANALGTGTVVSGAPNAGVTTVNTNSQLQVSNVVGAIPERLKLNGQGIINDGALLNVAGNNVWSGTVELDSDTTFGAKAGTSLNITGQISDLGAGHSLTKVGDGTITLSHSGGNTYRGFTTINDGILGIGANGALGNSPTHASTTIVNYNQNNDIGGTLQLDNEDPNSLNGTDPGFVISNETLILNGPGFGGKNKGIGALDNLNGNNTWAGNVTLGSADPPGYPVSIGVEAHPLTRVPTNLLISGTIVDPSGTPTPPVCDLLKIGNGRLIFTASNKYTGTTEVVAGILNAEDSQALGPSGKTAVDAIGNPLPIITVDDSAALELSLQTDVVNNFGMVPNPALDSVTHTLNQMNFGNGVGKGGYYLQLTGLGIPILDTGALHSISGINDWLGNITLNGNVGIGVEPDPNAHASNQYFTLDYSLKVDGVIQGATGVLTKVDDGQLIPTNKNTYSSAYGDPLILPASDFYVSTDVQAGWITIENFSALGSLVATLPQTLQPYTEVDAGGALHILGTGFSIGNNFLLSGTGFSHPYQQINEAGALENLDGDNTITGIIQLNGVAGIGVEQVGLLGTPTPQLTLTGSIDDYNGTAGGITKLGSKRLIIQGQGTYTGPVDIKTGVLLDQNSTALGAGVSTTTVEAGAALELGSTTTKENGGVQTGIEVWGEHLVLNGTGDAAFNDNPLTILSSMAGTTSLYNLPIDQINDPTVPLVPIDNIWRGPITLGNNLTITVTQSPEFGPMESSRLILDGNINDTSVSSLTLTGGGELDLAGNNSYRGTTFINQGVLTAESNQALGAAGFGEVQTLSITGATTGTTQFTVAFNNGVTNSVSSPITFTGVSVIDSRAIAAALDGLATIGGGGNTGGFVLVSQTAPGTFSITFGGSLAGFKQPLIGAAIVPTTPGSVSVVETLPGAGGTVVAPGASLQLASNVSIGGEQLVVQGAGVSATPDIPTQWFPVGPAPIDDGQTPTFTTKTGNVTGRVTGVVADPQDSNVIYIATAGGGAWKTIDGGVTWRPLFDAIPDVADVVLNNLAGSTFTLTYSGQTTTALAPNASALTVQNALDALPNIGPVGGYVIVTLTNPAPLNTPVYNITFEGTLSGNAATQLAVGGNIITQLTGTVTTGSGTIGVASEGEPSLPLSPEFAMYVGAIAMDPNNSNIIYIGTGETDNSPDSFYGTGVYKSTDGGVTWSLASGTETQAVTVKGLDNPQGFFTLTFEGQTTIPLDIHSTNLAVQTALDALTTIKGVNSTVTVTGTNATFGTPVNEVQQLTITQSGTMVLTFNGATTGVITITGTLATDAPLIQNALDALSTIGGVGSTVSVTFNPNATGSTEVFTITFMGGNPGVGFYTQTLITAAGVGMNPATVDSPATELIEGGVTYDITFNGVLARTDAPIMTTAATGGSANVKPLNATSVMSMPDPFNPFESKGISQLLVTYPNGPTKPPDIIAASGDGGPPTDEVQRFFFNGFPFPANTSTYSPPSDSVDALFNISFTGADSSGAVVIDSTATNGYVLANGIFNLVYFANNETFTDPNTNITYKGTAATADEMQFYLDQLGNIGTVGGFVTVVFTPAVKGKRGQPGSPAYFSVTFQGTLSDNYQQLMTTNWPTTDSSSYTGPTIFVEIYTPGVPVKVVNGTPSMAGIWRLQNNLWFNLTGVVSTVRSTIKSTNSSDSIFGPTSNESSGSFPNTPGPDDDYRLTFPSTGATWSGVQLADGILYAALGTSQGSNLLTVGSKGSRIINSDGVYWTSDPFDPSPIWYVGDPFNSNNVVQPDIESSTEFPSVISNFGSIKIAAADTTVYASVANPDGSFNNVYFTIDSGQIWTTVATTPPDYMSNQGAYDNAILVDPFNPNLVIVGGTNSNIPALDGQIFASQDGGSTWIDISIDGAGNGPHTSVHALAFDAVGDLLDGNDGGIWRLDLFSDGLWHDLNGNLAISQLNSVAGNPSLTTSAFAGAQSNGTVEFNNKLNWAEVDDKAGGEMGGGPVYVDPNNPNIVYAVQYQLSNSAVMRESLDGGATWSTLLKNPQIFSSTAALAMDPINPDRILVSGGIDAKGVNGPAFTSLLWESFNEGSTFVNLGTTLPKYLAVTDIALASYQGTFVYDSRFPAVVDEGSNTYDPDTFYVTDGANIYVTKDGGSTWQPCSLPGGGGTIEDIEVDPSNRDTVYAVRNDFGVAIPGAPPTYLYQLYQSTDAGVTWTEIGNSNNLPDVPAWKLVIDPRNGNLYLGTDDGVYVLPGGTGNAQSNGGTVTWQRFGSGMPDVQVKDLVLNQSTNTLLAGTYGRSMFQLFLDSAETAPQIQTLTLGGPATGTFELSFQGQTTSPLKVGDATLAADMQTALNGLSTIGGVGGGVFVNQAGPGSFQFTFTGSLGSSTQLQITAGTLTGNATAVVGVTTPAPSALLGLSGSTVWTGPVALFGPTTIGAYGTQVLPNGFSAASLNIIGQISDQTGGTTNTLTKVGNGDVILTGSNLYAGTTLVQQGALVSANNQALGGTTNGTTVENFASLELASNLDAEPVLLDGNGIAFDGHYQGALRNISGFNTFTGPVILSTVDPLTATGLSTSTIGADSGSQLSMTGAISGGSSVFRLAKEGTGTVSFGGIDSYSGTTAVYRGALQLANSKAIVDSSNGAEVLDGAQLQLQSSSSGSGITINVPLQLSGTGIDDTGALVSTGGSNTWAGSVTATSLPGFAPFTTPLGVVALAANAGATLNIATSIKETASMNTGLIAVAGPAGAGTVDLQTADTYSGYTEVEAGNLEIQNPSALGTRTGVTKGVAAIQRITTLSEVDTALGLGTFTLSLGLNLVTLAWDVPATGGVGPTASIQNAVTSLVDSFLTANGFATTLLQSVAVTQTTIQTTSASGPDPSSPITGYLYTVTITFKGILAGTDIELTAAGDNTTAASASPVALGGYDTLVDNGAELQLGTGAGIVSNHFLSLSGDGANNDGALHNVSGTNIWSGLITMQADSAFGADAKTSLTISGGLVPAYNLTTVDPGTVIFPKGSPADTQALTIIEAGSVQVDGSIGAVELDGGTISGTGTVGAITTENTTGDNINPGDNFPNDTTGTLNVGGTGVGSTAVNLDSNDQVFVDLGNSASHLNHDLLNVTNGGIDLGGATLTGMVSVNVLIGDSFTILQTDAADTITGQFAGYSTPTDPGASSSNIVFLNGLKFVVDYYPNKVVMTRTAVTDTLALAASIASPVYGQPETFTATMTLEPGATLPPVGSSVIEFTVTDPSGSTHIYKIPLTATGTATWDPTASFPLGTAAPLSLGLYKVSAAFNANDGPQDAAGNPFFVPSSTSPASVTVKPAATTTTLSSSWLTGTIPVFGEDITFTATVTSNVFPEATNTLAPTGTVTFYDGTTPLTTVPLNSSDQAILDTSSLSSTLSSGSHTITAVYNGDGTPPNYSTSSASLIQQVSTDTTTTTITTSENPSTYGDQVTFTASLTANLPGTLPPSGSVTFTAGGVVLATIQLDVVGSSATAVYTTSYVQLHAGANQTVTATYTGDSNFTTSSASLNQTVNKDTTTTALASSVNPLVYGQPVTFTATVSADNPNAGAPTGTVTFKDGFAILGIGTLSTSVLGVATATISTTPLQLGVGANQTIIAIYNGDSNFIFSSTSNSQTVNQDATTTAINSSVLSAVYGQKVTFTANISANTPGSGLPTGIVTFKDNGVLLGTGTLNNSGTATYTTTAMQLPVLANQTITASYGGDGNFTSSSQSLSLTVNQDPTTITLKSSANPTDYGEQVTFTANVSSTTPGSGSPDGSVTFMDGTTFLGTGALNTVGSFTTATFTTTAFQLSVGNNQAITATYNSNSGNYAGNSASLNETVNQAPTATTLTSSTAPTVYGQVVTFTATVSVISPGSGTPTGFVTFRDNGATLGTGTLSPSGTATYTTSALQLLVGNQPITATYNGDSNFSNSTGALTQTVKPDATTTTITSSPGSSVYGQAVTFTATVSANSPGSGVPTGAITFLVGSTALGTVSLQTMGGVQTATYTTTALQLPVGNQTITANYGGDNLDFVASTSSLTQTVSQDGTSTTLTASPNASVYGQTVTFTATVIAKNPGGISPSGTVVFMDGNTFLGIGTVSTTNGATTASLTTTALQLSAGPNQSITALYSGDGNYTPSTSAALSQTVKQDPTTTFAVTSTNPSVYGQPITFTATVSANNLVGGAPSGTVTFTEGGTTLGSPQLVSVGGVMTATFATTAFQLSVGANQSILASYSGDSNYASSTVSLSQTVNPDPTTTTVTSSVNPTVFGQDVTFTATVVSNGPGSGIPTGTVTFKSGSLLLGTVTLINSGGVNSASYTTTAQQLPVGSSETITATYNSDGNYSTSSATLVQRVNQDNTTTTVSSSPNSSAYGQPVTFIATVSANSPGSGRPTGTVTFDDGATFLGTGTLSTNGGVTTATFTTGSFQLPVAPGQTITANYGGDSNFTSSSATLTQNVFPVGTSTSIISSVNPAVSGQLVTFTATVVSDEPSTGTPGGLVTFVIDGNYSAAATVGLDVNGVAQFSTNMLGMGQHTVVATYDGTTDFGQSSAAVTQSVLISSTTSVSSSENPSTYGDSVTLTAKVTPNLPGFGAVSGSVIFTIDGTPYGSAVSLSGGMASISLSTLTIGTHSVAVSYSGDSNYQISNGSLTQTVLSGTTTILSASAAGTVYGQQETFTATVAAVPPGSGTPTGSVAFYIDGSITPAGTGILNGVADNDQASFSINNLPVGPHTFSAIYQGDANFASSTTQTSLNQQVTAVGTSMVVTASAKPAIVGQQVQFTATVTSAFPSTADPAGSVNFVIGGTTISEPLVQTGVDGVSSAQLIEVFSTKSIQNIAASYAGTTNFNASTFSISETVLNASTTTLKSSANPSLPHQSVTFTATVKGAAKGTGTPTGSVTFTIDGVATSKPLNTLGVAAYTLVLTNPGNHAVSVTYNGSNSFASSTTTLTQKVQYHTKTTIFSSGSPSFVGQPVTFTAQVAPVSPGTSIPGGSTTFYIDGIAQPAAPLFGGQAVLNAGLLSVGKHTIRVVYNADDPSNSYATSSATFTETIVPIASSITANYSAPNGFLDGQTFSITVNALDYQKQLATGFNDSGTVTVIKAPAGGTINGLNGSLNFSNGTITIMGLSLSKKGTYVVEFSVDTLTFNLTINSASRRS